MNTYEINGDQVGKTSSWRYKKKEKISHRLGRHTASCFKFVKRKIVEFIDGFDKGFFESWKEGE